MWSTRTRSVTVVLSKGLIRLGGLLFVKTGTGRRGMTRDDTPVLPITDHWCPLVLFPLSGYATPRGSSFLTRIPALLEQVGDSLVSRDIKTLFLLEETKVRKQSTLKTTIAGFGKE